MKEEGEEEEEERRVRNRKDGEDRRSFYSGKQNRPTEAERIDPSVFCCFGAI